MSNKRYRIEIITPLFVGSGETAQSGFDFVAKNGEIHFLDEEAVAVEIESKVRGFKDAAAFAKEIKTICGNDKKLANLRKGEPLKFTGKEPSEIKRFMRDAFYRPYIPGSSIKGAIRTALLWKIAANKVADGVFKDFENAIKLELAAKKCKDKELAPFLHGNKTEPNYDIGRTHIVRDVFFDMDAMQVYQANIWDVRVKHVPEFGWWNKKGNPLEVTPDAAVSIHIEGLMPKSSKILEINFKNEMLAFDKKINRELGFDKALLNAVTNLDATLQMYSRYLIEKEINYFRDIAPSRHEVVAFYNDLLEKVKNDAKSIFLRIGSGSGWIGMTGGLYTVKCRTYPKTRKLVQVDGKFYPLGWVKLVPTDSNEKPKLPEGLLKRVPETPIVIAKIAEPAEPVQPSTKSDLPIGNKQKFDGLQNLKLSKSADKKFFDDMKKVAQLPWVSKLQWNFAGNKPNEDYKTLSAHTTDAPNSLELYYPVSESMGIRIFVTTTATTANESKFVQLEIEKALGVEK